ncbi:MAG: J domain-containing protein [Bacteroidales bacterium]|nr:J domain-containing protein [Bacteroidales bacterium]
MKERHIVLYSGSEELLKELETLKRKSSELFLQLEYMEHQEAPRLSYIYQYETRIGTLEFELLLAEVNISLLNLAISLRQIAINLGKTADDKEINKQVEAEKEKFKAKIEDKESEIKSAKESAKSSVLNPDESQELRKLYRKIAKALHPDMNPKVSQKGKRLFIKATEAYHKGDLNILRQIVLSLKNNEIIDGGSGDCSEISEAEIIAQIEKIKKTIKDFETRIAYLNTQFPFIYREKLKDEHWINQRRSELEEKIAKANKKIEELNNYLKILESWTKE